MADSDELETGDIVLATYENDDESEAIHLGRVEGFDELGVEVSMVRQITDDEVVSGWAGDGWSIEKVGVEYDEDRDAVRIDSGEWTNTTDVF